MEIDMRIRKINATIQNIVVDVVGVVTFSLLRIKVQLFVKLSEKKPNVVWEPHNGSLSAGFNAVHITGW